MANSLKCLIQYLEQTISPDKNVLAETQLALEKYAQDDMGQFISNMSVVIADPNNSPIARQAAGLQLKNCLTVKDVTLKKECLQRWSKLEEETRMAVVERLISTLGTENIHPSCAAQCLAYIAVAESLFPGTQPSSEITSLEDLLSELCNVVVQPANEHRKEAALEAIAYICQEIHVLILVNSYTSILHSILFCMEDSKSTTRIRLAAARALLSSLECIYPTFDTEEGRDAIMQVVCDGTQSSSVEESVIWLQVLVKIGSCYYHHLENYMESAIVPITLKAMASTDSDIALQGMEFWCSVAEIEFNLASGAYDPAHDVVPSSCYAEKALPKLVPLLMSALVGWQDDPNDIDDFDDWTPFKGACSCLMLLAECCSNTVATYVTPKIIYYTTRSDWRYRNAALWTIGSILVELKPEKAFSEISPFMANIWELIYDKTSAKVRYAAQVLMGRIFEFCPALIPSDLRKLIKGLLVHLEDDDHRVAAAASKTLSLLVREIFKITSEKKEGGTRLVAAWFLRYYKKIVKKLLECSGKFRDSQKCAAQEALVDVLLNSPDVCYVTVKGTIKTLMGRLRYEVAAEGDDFPYAMLSRAMRKLKAEEIQMRHDFMCKLMSLLTSEGPQGVVKDKEDVFLATSTTIALLPHDELNVHLPAMIAYFKLSVESRDPSPTVVSLIGDLFSALGTQSLPYLDGFCLNLFDLLARNKIPTKLRSSCVAALIDIANSVGVKNFWPYIAYTLTQLEYASSITVKKDPEHEELQENMLQLYTALFVFICGQVSGQSSKKKKNQELISQLSLMEDCLTGFSELMLAIVDEDASDAIIIASAELVGIIFQKLSFDTAMKYLESKLNLKWLVSAAVHLADNSRESKGEFSEPKFAMSALEAFNAVE